MPVYVVIYMKGELYFVDAVYKTYELATQRVKELEIQNYDVCSVVPTTMFTE